MSTITTVEVITENGVDYIVRTDINGAKYWYFDGQLHREYGPAVEFASGDGMWYKHGVYQRPVTPEDMNIIKKWYDKELLKKSKSIKSQKENYSSLNSTEYSDKAIKSSLAVTEILNKHFMSVGRNINKTAMSKDELIEVIESIDDAMSVFYSHLED